MHSSMKLFNVYDCVDELSFKRPTVYETGFYVENE